MASNTLRRIIGLILQYAGLLAFMAFTTFPFFWALSVALSADPSYIWLFPDAFVPHDFSFMWFKRVFAEMPFMVYLKNSTIMSFWTIIGVVAVSVMAGYPLARLKFPGRGLIFAGIIATLMLPSETNIIPNFITLKNFGMWAAALQEHLHLPSDWNMREWVGLNSYFGAIIPNFAGAFGIFLMKQAFEQIPQDLVDAARVDGATELQIMWRVMVPVSIPSIAALTIFTLVNAWNDYLWPSIVMNSKEKLPLAVGVFNDLTGPFATSTSLVMAAIVMTVIPVLIFFAFTQRYFIGGLDGAVK
ncbi:carbohydrate ABC transporter membrane protein 2, CUT1 family (TC 3.A.1.1.-) [Andreprevotia lacus DSM 23236]|jgi:putative chitobiose transport system permease protein|uniref:Carbohydrate ABC transporter membrane protein 2, CUT1 family (TC 3.A.1.1.-) n=1 Tax=Andreprevotia lacus DSM 23236 TaxID=1121001 RepID=A0A1W1X780_9NEIS|nr:carbohydrate ABC transporter permease [Andreprevotia lacus]SMC19795.1 carbohydrate ABC transporter membrane protein 2, CUT1 family (TC 3.A.1.1.-) [Andreprevotia lacus DSM 23236]